ncbi:MULTISPECIES: plasmid replication protein RepC [Rhizobium]|uniref:RepC n=3 Tax=Rhizobium TaxID=379 RepID=Q5EWX4_RHITR|nr:MULTISPECIES: plasmid replication protein RepC [Rhizobium]AAW84268.1 RepC [Rhizobium leucaenae USDA 9039]AGB73524.1 replication protein C [Rhizobium tropici CIAT 899]AYG76927.1 replication protein C [Rhizobium sp. CCGE532]ENN84779.1 replication protein C [Rhizobium freirei PRF 81]MBB4245498.1 replication initiation protein RepC [Rhizobium tropici]
MEDMTTCQRPVGRKITPQRAEFRRWAKSAEIGMVTRAQLAVLAQNLTCTGLINGTESHLLLILINTAPADTFDTSGRPIVFKSNRQLAFEVGRSAGRVSRMLSKLFDLGLITMQDSGNYKRYPVRNSDGVITDGCGVDLRILVLRYGELTRLVKDIRAEKRATEAALRRYRGALRNIRCALAAVADVSATMRQRIADRVERISNYIGIAAKASNRMLRRATVLLEWSMDRLMRLDPRPQDQLGAGKTTCVPVENDMQKQTTPPYQSKRSSNVREGSAHVGQYSFPKASAASSSAFEETATLWRGSVSEREPQRQALIALKDVLRAAPALAELGCTPKSFQEFVRLTPMLCRFVGISEDARRGAVEAMGEQQAAVAVAVILEKANRQEVSSPGGYLRAMAERAAAGRLYLTRSVFGLAARRDLEQSTRMAGQT